MEYKRRCTRVGNSREQQKAEDSLLQELYSCWAEGKDLWTPRSLVFSFFLFLHKSEGEVRWRKPHDLVSLSFRFHVVVFVGGLRRSERTRLLPRKVRLRSLHLLLSREHRSPGARCILSCVLPPEKLTQRKVSRRDSNKGAFSFEWVYVLVQRTNYCSLIISIV